MPKNKDDKKIEQGAIDLAAAALAAKIWENQTADEIADLCIAIAQKIVEHD